MPTSLGALRNLDVAQSDTLPALASAYVQGDAQRAQFWQAMTTALAQAAALQDHLGAARDMTQLSCLVAKPDGDLCLLEFLRGVAVGVARQE